MEPPGTAPGSGPLITRGFIAIVPLRGRDEYRGEWVKRQQLLAAAQQPRIHAENGKQDQGDEAQQGNRPENPQCVDKLVQARAPTMPAEA